MRCGGGGGGAQGLAALRPTRLTDPAFALARMIAARHQRAAVVVAASLLLAGEPAGSTPAPAESHGALENDTRHAPCQTQDPCTRRHPPPLPWRCPSTPPCSPVHCHPSPQRHVQVLYAVCGQHCGGVQQAAPLAAAGGNQGGRAPSLLPTTLRGACACGLVTSVQCRVCRVQSEVFFPAWGAAGGQPDGALLEPAHRRHPLSARRCAATRLWPAI